LRSEQLDCRKNGEFQAGLGIADLALAEKKATLCAALTKSALRIRSYLSLALDVSPQIVGALRSLAIESCCVLWRLA
jgi:hypothetical protein